MKTFQPRQSAMFAESFYHLDNRKTALKILIYQDVLANWVGDDRWSDKRIYELKIALLQARLVERVANGFRQSNRSSCDIDRTSRGNQ